MIRYYRSDHWNNRQYGRTLKKCIKMRRTISSQRLLHIVIKWYILQTYFRNLFYRNKNPLSTFYVKTLYFVFSNLSSTKEEHKLHLFRWRIKKLNSKELYLKKKQILILINNFWKMVVKTLHNPTKSKIIYRETMV